MVGEFKALDDSIRNQYQKDVQTKRVWDIKQKAINVLEAAAKQTIIGRDFDLKIWLTGSSVNGFGNKNSDADMCLVTYSPNPLNRKHIINLLHQIRRKLLDDRRYLCGQQPEVIPAKVPILRVYLNMRSKDHAEMKVQCDINVDNHIGIRNSWLLRCYSELDPRIREFIYVVKRFAKSANLNDAAGGSLSTYSWLLLSIHFLQSGVKPAVLPIVQQYTNEDSKRIYHDHFAHDELEDVSTLACKIKGKINFKSENTMGVGELFQKWLTYYSLAFNFRDFIVSIRMGKLACRFGEDSLVSLNQNIRDTEREIAESKSARNGGKPRPRKTSGVFVKKGGSKNNSKEDSESESEENRSSIVKKSSDEEEEEEGEEVKIEDESVVIIEDENDSGVQEEELYEEAVRIFGSEVCADIIHPNLADKKAEQRRIENLKKQPKADIYKTQTDKELVLSQRKLIKSNASMDIYFNTSDYPTDRIVICIEEPFQKDNVARAVFDKEKAIRIIRALRFCRERFEEIREKQSEDLSLDTLHKICREFLSANPQTIKDTIQGKRRRHGSGEGNGNDAIFVGDDTSSDSDDDNQVPPAKRQKISQSGGKRGSWGGHRGRGGRGRGRGRKRNSV